MLELLRRRLGLKLLSLGLAVLLWLFVSQGDGAKETEVEFSVPVELRDLPSDMDVIQRHGEAVDVRLRGPKRVVANLSREGLVVPLDLAGTEEGKAAFQILPQDLLLPEGVTVARVNPSSVSLTLERAFTVHLRVDPVVELEPGSGVAVRKVSAHPGAVDVRVPRSLLNRGYSKVHTFPVRVDGSSLEVESGTALRMPDPRIRLAEGEVSTVQVRVELVKR